MFTNPIGQLFNKPEGEEKKKKRNKKSKKVSQEVTEEANTSITNSTTSLNTFESASNQVTPVDAAPESSFSGLIDIVNEINNSPSVNAEVTGEPVVEQLEQVERTEQVETQYEEKPVEESTMQAIYQSIQNAQRDEPIEEESAWEAMLSGPAEKEWESQVDAAPQAVDSVWESLLSTPPPTAEPEIDVQKQTCINNYRITDASYDLVKAFYDEQKDEPTIGLLKNDLLKYLLKNALTIRPELEGVSEEDVDRALKVIDSNNDDKINFEEFIQLLALFFSSKNNIQKRISDLESSSSN